MFMRGSIFRSHPAACRSFRISKTFITSAVVGAENQTLKIEYEYTYVEIHLIQNEKTYIFTLYPNLNL